MQNIEQKFIMVLYTKLKFPERNQLTTKFPWRKLVVLKFARLWLVHVVTRGDGCGEMGFSTILGYCEVMH